MRLIGYVLFERLLLLKFVFRPLEYLFWDSNQTIKPSFILHCTLEVSWSEVNLIYLWTYRTIVCFLLDMSVKTFILGFPIPGWKFREFAELLLNEIPFYSYTQKAMPWTRSHRLSHRACKLIGAFRLWATSTDDGETSQCGYLQLSYIEECEVSAETWFTFRTATLKGHSHEN